jgi:CelD/BcsL family acetyltransferase involved in cellulose biosynthesis
VLSSNGETAAVEIAFRAGGHLAVHVIVYNLKFEKSGAGALLMEDSIRRSHGEGIESFDLLAPGDEYKMDWADGKIEVVDWAQPLTIKGQAYARLYLGLVRSKLKSAMTAIPSAFRLALPSVL